MSVEVMPELTPSSCHGPVTPEPEAGSLGSEGHQLSGLGAHGKRDNRTLSPTARLPEPMGQPTPGPHRERAPRRLGGVSGPGRAGSYDRDCRVHKATVFLSGPFAE